MKRLPYNLILFLIIIPTSLIGGMMGPFQGEDVSSFGLFLFILISIFRFKNIGMSGWRILALIIPFWNLYLLFQLIFSEKKKDRKITFTEVKASKQLSKIELEKIEKFNDLFTIGIITLSIIIGLSLIIYLLTNYIILKYFIIIFYTFLYSLIILFYIKNYKIL